MTSLSFTNAAATDAAKLGILVASTIAGVIGHMLLRAAPVTPQAADGPDESAAGTQLEAVPA